MSEEQEIYVESSENQTKKWRKDNLCCKDGQKDSSCEKHQRNLIKQITQMECPKSKCMRINNRTLEFINYSAPMTQNGKNVPDGFDWSEDFDGLQEINNIELYYNLKFVCENGGGQTRSLREVYHFIETQLKFIKKNTSKNIIFINILDGKYSNFRKSCYEFLLNLEEYKEHNNKCFVGDMKQFQSWFSKFIK
jgi:hypothetical protein